MISTSHVIVVARMVRLAAAVSTAGLIVGFIAVSSFASRYGTSTPMTVGTTSTESALSVAVLEQENAGLACTEKPALTNVVLFQREGDTEVGVLTFDEAIRASSAREGWIRRYCV
jgi:hypothetical protein